VLGKEVLAAVPEKKQLRVTIVSAAGLRNADTLGSGKSDPYCAVEVEGVKGLKLCTKVVDNSLNPVWNEDLDFTDYVAGKGLVFKVWDKDPWPKSDDPLGHVTLGSDKFLPNGTGEDPLEMLLLDAGKGVKATLTVKISVLHDPESAAEEVSNSIEAIDEASAGTAAKPADIATLQAVEEVPATSVVEEATAEQVEAQPVDNEVHNEANGATSEKSPVVAAAESTPDAGGAVEEVLARAEPTIEKEKSNACWRPGQGRFRRHLRNASCFGRGK
jgi:hypothetical protein